jgi:hypothetical protein
MKKTWTFCWCLLALGADAQPGIDEMQQAQQNLRSSFFSAIDCSLVLAAIIATIGAVRIFHNWQMGQKDIHPQLAAWFFAIFFVVLSGAFLRAVFGI